MNEEHEDNTSILLTDNIIKFPKKKRENDYFLYRQMPYFSTWQESLRGPIKVCKDNVVNISEETGK